MTSVQFYTDSERENDPNALPDAEVFTESTYWNDDEDNPLRSSPGFYWWLCSPGCLPDSDPIGPFETEQEAIEDARERAAY